MLQVVGGYDWTHIILYALQTVFYPKNAMWYLLATIIGVTLITEIYLRCKKWNLWLLLVGIVGYLIVLLCNNYYFLIDGTIAGNVVHTYLRIFGTARSMFLAPMFLGIGFLLRTKNTQAWMKKHKKYFVFGVLVGIIFLLIEAHCIYGLTYADDRGFFVSQLVLIPSIAAFSVCYDLKIKLPYRLLRRLSTSIYFVHGTVRTVISCLPIYNGNTIILFLTTVLLSICVALISYRIDNKYINAVFG